MKMTSTNSQSLTSAGLHLDTSPSSFGFLRDSRDLLDNPDPGALQTRLAEEGYLYLRGFFEPALILNARRSMLTRLREENLLSPEADVMEGILSDTAKNSGFRPDLIKSDKTIDRVVFGPEIRAFYQKLLGGDVRNFDYKWLRTIGPGHGTKPHCDIVYMGRGTWDLFTAWIPYGQVDLELGGLMLLEGSHKQKERLKKYLETDVDEYCENRESGQQVKRGERFWEHRNRGFLSTNPVSLREKLGGRWLTAEFAPGDLLTFGMGMVHASLDNRTANQVRISTDTRYQRADEPIDERWVGENPIGHSLAGKRGRIC